jgi:hypothetical protein
VVALLFGAYRALGRPASPVTQPDALLRTVLRTARQASIELAAIEKSAGGAALETAQARDAGTQRRSLEGCSQSLERLDPDAMAAGPAVAHRQLSQAVEELMWAARIAASPGSGRGGLKLATAELRASADRLLEEAAQLLRPAAVTEEVHRPG